MRIHRLLLIGLLAGAAAADTVFVDRYTTNGIALERRGTARMKWGGLVSLYDAALYLPAGTPSEQVFEDQPKRLEICYLKGLSRDLLVEAGDQALADSVAPDRVAGLGPRLEQINRLYRSVKAQDRYALTYLPGEGTELSLNGVRQGVIPGADFAAAYYTIWLGTNCPKPEVRDELLGRPKR